MDSESLILFATIALLFLIWMVSGLWTAYRNKERLKQKLRAQKGNRPNKRYEDMELRNLASGGMKPYDIDEITWNDLSMDELFARVDYTYSQSGEQVLYEILRNPTMDETVLRHREEVISFFAQNDDARIKMQLRFAAIGRNGKYSLPQYLSYLESAPQKSNLKDGIVLLCIFLSAIALLWKPDYAAIVLCILLVYNFISYIKEKGKQSPYIATFSYVIRFLRQLDKLIEACPAVLSDEKTQMQEIRNSFRSFRFGAFVVTDQNKDSGNPVSLLLDYVCMFLHLDLIKYRQMHKIVANQNEQLLLAFETAGFIEAMISIALYRSSLHKYCLPTLNHEACPTLSCEGLVHPYLEEAVGNDLTAEKGILLTGSNASGKSTFLKAVALAGIMAQSIHTVCADCYTSSYVKVYSSMALSDDIIAGNSYFIVEIMALKRIFDAAKQNVPIRAFVDEVLRGTNTAERIAASVELLKALCNQNVQVFAATHDLELAKLLMPGYENYHFTEQIVDGDVLFSYEIKEGYATSRNAIALLSAFGFDKEVVAKAKDRVKQFEPK